MESAIRRKFLADYAVIRHAEGRGSEDPAYYASLPYLDATGKNAWQWEIRARSYRYLERFILPKIERETARPLDILDLGAGNGWMSYRLTLRKHRVVALDIFSDEKDGLGAIRNYPVHFTAMEAEFDRLPVDDCTFDVAIYNSSFHYSSDYRGTLTEARRCLRPDGRVIIMDSPVYKRPEHGERMRAERQAQFERQYGFCSDALRSIEYLDEPALQELARDLDIEWSRSEPWYGWRWAMRPWKARLNGKRPPSRFFILVGKFRAR